VVQWLYGSLYGTNFLFFSGYYSQGSGRAMHGWLFFFWLGFLFSQSFHYLVAKMAVFIILFSYFLYMHYYTIMQLMGEWMHEAND
jgi:hypothetical protein